MSRYIESWWGRVPMKCSCCKTLSVEVLDSEHMAFYCRDHGLVAEGRREAKRGGLVDWRFFRLEKAYGEKKPYKEPIQLPLYDF